MIRVALVLALSFAHGSCSGEKPTGNSFAAGGGNGAPARKADRGMELPISATQIAISSNRGQATVELVDNAATRALVRMLPVTIEMRDHLRQEKTGTLPSPLPESRRQTDFSEGMVGLWGNDDFVIYYRNGHVPAPGIIVLGRAIGDVSIFDRPGAVTVRLHHAH